MELVKDFNQSGDGEEWILVEVDLPADANRSHIRVELGYMAEDFVTQVRYTEIENGLELGFRSEAMRNTILEVLSPVIEQSIRMPQDDAAPLWKKWSREDRFPPSANVKRHGYVETVDCTSKPIPDEFA